MSAHTAGPWRPCYHWQHTNCPCGEHRGYIWAADGETVVAQLGCETDHGGQTHPYPMHDEARANAFLLAASPVMLSTLVAVLACSECGEDYGQCSRCRAQMKTAVALASLPATSGPAGGGADGI